MDRRIERTYNSLKKAFLKLREEKPLEKISVKELVESAGIHKATFYGHFHDIEGLSEYMENEVIDQCLEGITDPRDILLNVSQFVDDLGKEMVKHLKVIKILFNGSRTTRFTEIIEQRLDNIIAENFPDYKLTLHDKMKMVFLVEGGYRAFSRFYENNVEEILDLIVELTKSTQASQIK